METQTTPSETVVHADEAECRASLEKYKAMGANARMLCAAGVHVVLAGKGHLALFKTLGSDMDAFRCSQAIYAAAMDGQLHILTYMFRECLGDDVDRYPDAASLQRAHHAALENERPMCAALLLEKLREKQNESSPGREPIPE